MIVTELQDLYLINQAVMHPKINKSVSDDFTAGQKITTSDGFMWLGIFDKNDYLGLIMAHAHNTVLYEVHTALLPKAWGSKAIRCCELIVSWLIENTDCERIITSVPENNTLALRLAKKTGFKEYGFNPNSILKDNNLIGQTMLGLNKEQFKCQQQQ